MGKNNLRILRCYDPAVILTLQTLILPQDQPLPFGAGPWWVMWEGTEAVAFASLKHYASDPQLGYLSRAGVMPSYRGKGIQRRLIRVREAYARRSGLQVIVTDTSHSNLASSNSLIGCGYKLYQPAHPWGFPDGNYWRKRLKD
jgi:ribosomal protein S18 acetylase RimI-like enzyme